MRIRETCPIELYVDSSVNKMRFSRQRGKVSNFIVASKKIYLYHLSRFVFGYGVRDKIRVGMPALRQVRHYPYRYMIAGTVAERSGTNTTSVFGREC